MMNISYPVVGDLPATATYATIACRDRVVFTLFILTFLNLKLRNSIFDILCSKFSRAEIRMRTTNKKPWLEGQGLQFLLSNIRPSRMTTHRCDYCYLKNCCVHAVKLKI